MQTRPLGKSGLLVSEVGLGCWQLGGDFGPVTPDTVHQIVATALDQGMQFFDTADVYGGGQSEAYLGQILSERKPAPVIATKYGRGPGTYPDGYSLKDLRDSVKRAQDRLRRDQLDLLQLHCIPTEVLRRGEVFDWLRTVQQEGHIGHFGASVETIEEGLICVEQADLASLQVIFNLFRQTLLDELLPKAHKNGIGVIVRLPLASGMLSGKFSRETRFAATDHRNYNRDGQAFSVGETFAGIPFDKGLELVEELRAFLPTDMTLAEMAMRWLLDQEAVSAIIPGASTPDQVRNNAAVSALTPLSEELHQRLYQFYQDKVHQHIRGVY